MKNVSLGARTCQHHHAKTIAATASPATCTLYAVAACGALLEHPLIYAAAAAPRPALFLLLLGRTAILMCQPGVGHRAQAEAKHWDTEFCLFLLPDPTVSVRKRQDNNPQKHANTVSKMRDNLTLW